MKSDIIKEGCEAYIYLSSNLQQPLLLRIKIDSFICSLSTEEKHKEVTRIFLQKNYSNLLTLNGPIPEKVKKLS